MKINKLIDPFEIAHDGKNTSLVMPEVGDYKQHIFCERSDDGFEGNGYDWESLAMVLLDERFRKFKNEIKMASESGMFCMYSKNKKIIEDFAIAFHAICENESEMRDLFSRAEPA